MNPIVLYYFALIIITILTLIIILHKCSYPSKQSNIPKLPLGNTGWPIFGETLAYVSCPAKFIRDRMIMHSPAEVFKTSLAGEKTVVFCGPKANKFLFSNEGKLVSYWLPSSVAGALSYPKPNSDYSPSGKPVDELSYKFLRVDKIQHFVPLVDSMVQQHVKEHWLPNKEVEVYTLAKEFTFALSCRVLINVTLEQSRDIAKPFFILLDGLFSAPVNLPGMPYYKAIKGGKLVREKLVEIIKQRRSKLLSHNNNYSSGYDDQLDLLSRIIIDNDQNSKGLSEEEIASKVIGLMFAGFYPTSTTNAFMISNLADHPHVYEKILEEQLKIAESKGPGEALTWTDIQKMKYSWNVICETMRLTSPVPGNFREAKTDFTYAGFRIPKGWKVHWTLHSTHKNPDYFTDPEKFDPTRFEKNELEPYTFVPFGAGPRMCAGKEFARIEMLVFLHNVVTKFRFKKLNQKPEKIIYNPDPIPTNGLQIFLQPH